MEENKGLGQKLSAGSGFIIFVLILLILFLTERALYDAARLLVPNYDYFNDLSTIMIHALIIIPLLVISILINVKVGAARQKYAIAFIPYLATTVLLCFQLILQVSVYFYFHHTQLEYYAVILSLILISAGAIYRIQESFIPKS